MALMHDELAELPVTSIESVRKLILRYEIQILDGCNNADCTQVLCYTGRTNTSEKVVRKYTARSARAIAMTVCSGPNPRAYLCRHLAQDKTDSRSPPTEPRDPSALIQLLSDTDAVLSCDSSPVAATTNIYTPHRLLDQLSSRACREDAPSDPLSNADLVDALLPCFDSLLASLPTQRLAIWEMVDRDIVGKGFACPPDMENRPSDEKWNGWVPILDRLNDETYQRLLRRVLLVLGERMEAESLLQEAQSPMNGRTSLVCYHSSGRGVLDVLASRLIERSRGQPHMPLAIVVWLKRLFASVWDGKPVVVRNSVAHVILDALRELRVVGNTVSATAFQMPLIRLRVADMDLASSWHSIHGTTAMHILDFHFLFSPDQLIMCFRAINLRFMSLASSQAAKVCEFRRRRDLGQNAELENQSVQLQHEEEHYLLLYVSRGTIIKDTFDQLWQRRAGELRRPLRVRMGADELDIGHDLGGVQVEFFNIMCKHVFSKEAQLFTTDAQTGLSYIRAGSLQPLHMFELFGVLLALAMYNGITLPLRLPGVFYHILSCHAPQQPGFQDQITPEMIEDAWPAVAHSLRSLRTTFVEDLEFAFPLEANGVRMSCLPIASSGSFTQGAAHRLELKVLNAVPPGQHGHVVDTAQLTHAWPGWELSLANEEPKAVTVENVEEYIRTYSHWLCYTSVQPQLEALLHGFRSSEVIDVRTFSVLGVDNLKGYVEGTDTLDIQQLRAAARYDGYDAKQKYMQSFWRIVAAWPQEKQKLLLKFVTAAERIPITGASHLTFIIKRAHPEDLNALPTSSTCFGTLLLPRYASAEIMAQKLSLALEFGAEGFGTG